MIVFFFLVTGLIVSNFLYFETIGQDNQLKTCKYLCKLLLCLFLPKSTFLSFHSLKKAKKIYQKKKKTQQINKTNGTIIFSGLAYHFCLKYVDYIVLRLRVYQIVYDTDLTRNQLNDHNKIQRNPTINYKKKLELFTYI